MRILICAVEAPLPPTNGFRLAVSSLLRELRRVHDVQVLALRMPEQSPTGEEGLWLLDPPPRSIATDARDALRALARRRPLRADRVASTLRAPLREQVTRFEPDVVHVTSGRLAGLGPDLRGRPSVLAALDAWHLNVEAQAQTTGRLRRTLLRDEARRVRRFEASAFGAFGRVVVVSDEDAGALRALNERLRVEVIPNGVDATVFARPPDAPTDPETIVFTGVMSYAPNVAAATFLAQEVLPLVRARRPGAQLAIVGRAPALDVQALAASEGVVVTGEVPDVRPWLLRATAYVCPMQSGTGIKNKLLEAMAAEAPCVATPLALQGLRVEPDVEVLVGTNAQELSDGVLDLLDDSELRRRLGRAGRRYVLEHHDWSAVARAYDRVYVAVREETAA